MKERHERLNRLASEALDRHERLLQLKTMELLLGSMVRRIGIKHTRDVLQAYINHLDEFC